MLRVIDTSDRNQQWLGVADIMRAEAHEQANAALDLAAGRANGVAGITPERAIREGALAEEILKMIDEDEDIGILTLAAGTGKEGPGPLVTNLAKPAGSYPIPVAIVPGHLSDEELAKAVQNTVVAIMDIANRAIAARKEFGEKRSSSSASKDILTRTYEEQEQQLSVELPFVSEYSVRFKDIAIALREELLNRLPLKDRTSISTTVNKALYTSVSSIGDLLQISGDLLRAESDRDLAVTQYVAMGHKQPMLAISTVPECTH